MSLKSLIKSRYSIAIVCKVVSILTTFLATVFINRALGVSLKGEYTYILRIVDMLYIACGFGLGQTYAIYKRRALSGAKSIFGELILIHAALIGFIGVILTIVFHIEYGYAIFLITACSVMHNNISMIAVIEDSVKRNLLVTCFNIVYLVSLALIYYLRIENLNLMLIVYGVNELVIAIMSMIVFKIKLVPRLINKSDLIEIYRNGFLTMVVLFLISVNYSIDVVMLRHLSTSYYVGLYSVAVTFSNMFLVIPDALKELMFGNAAKKNFQKDVNKSFAISFAISLIIFIGFSLLGKFFIGFLYGDDYIPAYMLTLVIFIGSLSMIFFKILHPVYIAHEKQVRLSVILTISAVTNIVLNVFLIQAYDGLGASIASAISYTVCGIIILIDYHRMLHSKVI